MKKINHNVDLSKIEWVRDNKIKTTFWLYKSQREKINKIAKKYKVSQSLVIEKIIESLPE
jgi:hypothetical protein